MMLMQGMLLLEALTAERLKITANSVNPTTPIVFSGLMKCFTKSLTNCG
jgi:hypothetical protein